MNTKYEGIAIGGPIAGKWVAHNSPLFYQIIPPDLDSPYEVRMSEIAPEFKKVAYQYREMIIDGFWQGVWVTGDLAEAFSCQGVFKFLCQAYSESEEKKLEDRKHGR